MFYFSDSSRVSSLLSPPPVKFVIPWPEITRLERVSTGLMTEAIRVSTRQRQREFSMFLSLDEAFGVISQLADIALRRLLDCEGLELDRVLQQPTRITKRFVAQRFAVCFASSLYGLSVSLECFGARVPALTRKLSLSQHASANTRRAGAISVGAKNLKAAAGSRVFFKKQTASDA